MNKQSKSRVIVALVLFLSIPLSLLPGPASANTGYVGSHDKRSAGAMAVDAVVVRPLGFVGTVIGSALFVVSLPFSALGGNVDEAAHNLVVEPAKFTFTRPLGEYDRY